MRVYGFPVIALALVGAAQSAALQPRDVLKDLRNQAMKALEAAEAKSIHEKKAGCSLFQAPGRQDWNVMSAEERKAYISAVQCMYSSPSKSDPALVPGARTRYDDFVAQHINQTRSIHGTGNFLTWHRYFVHAYEKALRQECGYTGYQPYWNWFTYQDDLRASPIFDGSDTSMGGDGTFVQHNGSTGGGGTIYLPSGQGGGCISSGPFKGLQLNLGPISPTMDGQNKSVSELGYNPRCAKRDLTTYASSTWLTIDNLLNITSGAASLNVGTFQNELQGRFPDGFLGLHAAGHFSINGDAGDFYSSPNDPVFFLHHTMLDYAYWLWQAFHPDQAGTVMGTRTRFSPTAEKTTLQDVISMNYLNVDDVTIEDLMDTYFHKHYFSSPKCPSHYLGMTKPIPIIGAGIAGLTLGRYLLHRGIPFVLYEKASSKPRNSYAITLHSSAYRPLLSVLGIDEVTFKRRVAVDSETGGTGTIAQEVPLPNHNGLYDTSSSFRANRAKFEQVLQQGIDIRWEHTLQSVETTPEGPKLQFHNGDSCSAKLAVAADGVHSNVRKLLLPSAAVEILPYAVFNGKRKADYKSFGQVYGSAMEESNVIEKKQNDAILSASINDKKDDQIYINWIYSRPAREDPDPLYRPNRPLEGAQKIPDELFEEVSSFDNLTTPFSKVFDSETMRGDRMLHWLMRTTSAPLPSLQNVLTKSGVCFVGDAIHAEPIVGGNGANAAILDGLTLAEAIERGGLGGISTWYAGRYATWTLGVEESQQAIANMHHPSKQLHGNL
ncbi:hypothetical protein PTNB85_02526 [Pyrenophora teres f. teres]|nr:hypothetical protein PTNB85_02526 [Pyrenophora teres f. teres]